MRFEMLVLHKKYEVVECTGPWVMCQKESLRVLQRIKSQGVISRQSQGVNF